MTCSECGAAIGAGKTMCDTCISKKIDKALKEALKKMEKKKSGDSL